MGMFDDIYVSENKINLPLPKNRYQSKWLDCHLHSYQIDENGRITIKNSFGAPGEYNDKYHVAIDHSIYCDNEFTFYGDTVDGVWQEYTAVVVDNVIEKLFCYGKLIYDASVDSELDAEFAKLPAAWV